MIADTVAAPSTPEGAEPRTAVHIAPWNFPFRQPTFLEWKKYSQDGKSHSMSKQLYLTKDQTILFVRPTFPKSLGKVSVILNQITL